MTKRVSWIITDQNVTVNYEGETHIVKRSDVLADRLIKAVKEGKLQEIPALVSAAKRIETFSKGAFLVKDGKVEINGVAAPEVLGNKIIRFSDDGLPFQPLLKFAQNLQQNPSYRSVNELFQFLEKNDHPITENGNFIAYKRVKANFMDIYSGKFDNSVGNTVEVPRNQVDEDSNRTCSHGLHVANWDYAHTQFGSSVRDTDIMLEVEVNPADVVAIPTDYNQSKMRVCKYVVLGVVTTPFDPSTSLRLVNPDHVFDNDLPETDDTCCVAGVCDCDEDCDCDCVDSACSACVCSDTTCVECSDTLCDGDCADIEEEEEEDETDVSYPWEDETKF